MFTMVSPFFDQLLSSTDERVVKVDGTTREQWLLIISQLYPLTPLPDLTAEQLGKVLPVAHKRGAGLVLQCDDGELAVMRDMFEVVSPFFGQLLSSTDERVVKVDGTTREQWLLLLSQLYPLIPRPELTPEQLGKVALT
ncbi:hypothetical protein HaLaN_16738 [Haematococcus lacustris]|uniref:BTB domain-containing protein n=1 Tax=Haematococcus lacustris TaxID=44745 RepID=A0A699ZD64_HAELA|nr:hypothetical protein HaLaN_16738 [Haematococcus lacustris]